jgi:hypothetical protein
MRVWANMATLLSKLEVFFNIVCIIPNFSQACWFLKTSVNVFYEIWNDVFCSVCSCRELAILYSEDINCWTPLFIRSFASIEAPLMNAYYLWFTSIADRSFWSLRGHDSFAKYCYYGWGWYQTNWTSTSCSLLVWWERWSEEIQP